MVESVVMEAATGAEATVEAATVKAATMETATVEAALVAEAMVPMVEVEVKWRSKSGSESVGTGSRMVMERLCRLAAAYWPRSCAAADASRPRC